MIGLYTRKFLVGIFSLHRRTPIRIMVPRRVVYEWEDVGWSGLLASISNKTREKLFRYMGESDTTYWKIDHKKLRGEL